MGYRGTCCERPPAWAWFNPMGNRPSLWTGSENLIEGVIFAREELFVYNGVLVVRVPNWRFPRPYLMS